MPAKALPAWKSSYESQTKDHYRACQDNPKLPIERFWQAWIDENVTGLQSAAPFPGSTAKTTKTAFAPVKFPMPGTPVSAAKTLADAWKAFMTALAWPPMPPAAPFSVVALVQTSATGLAAAYPTLFAGLLAEFTKVPGDASTAFAVKAQAISSLFRTATIAAGIEIKGTGGGDPQFVPLAPVQ